MKRGALRLERASLALAIVAVAWIAISGAIGLLEPTETRYAEIAREMRATGDWLVPQLNGIAHFHKPPLAYWAIALGFGALGENEWGARVPGVLASLASLACFVWLARRRFSSLGIAPGIAVWIVGSSLYGIAMSHSVATDPYLTLAATSFWALAPSPWAIAAIGLGFLAKGPVVFVPTVIPVLIAAAWGRDRETLKLLGPAWGWLIAAAVGAPWYLAVALRAPDLIRYWMAEQMWARYTTSLYNRPGAPWYFIAVLIVGWLPWSAALISGLARLWRERSSRESKLLLCWLVVPLVFFSLSRSKLPAYLMPTLGAAGLIAASGLANGGRRVRIFTAAPLALLAAAGWLFGARALAQYVRVANPSETTLPLGAHLAFACLAYAATWALRGRAGRTALLTLLGFTSLIAALARYEAPFGSPRPLARVLIEHRVPSEPVVEFGRFNAGIPFYLREQVSLLEVPRETEFGAAAARDTARHASVFITRDSLVALASRHPRVWLLGGRAASRDLAETLGLTYHPLAPWRGEALGFITR